MEKQKNIPSLRFTEFIEEWQLYKLGHFFIERSEIANSENPLYSLTIENGIVPKSERYEREFLVNDIGEAYKVMYPNDYAFNPMNLRFGALARHKGNLKVGVSKYYNIFYCNIKGSQEFFEYYLTSHKMIQFYNKMATGSLLEKKRVHYLDFIEFKKPLPSLPEQQKIASFLTSVDERIAQLTKKKALLEQYKKGVMQKIFSQEIRFKDDNGKKFPEWEEKKLGEFLKLTQREVDKPSSNYLAIGVRSHCKGTFQKPDSEPAKIEMDKLYQVKEGDLIVNITFAWEGAIAMVKKEDENGLVSHRFPTYIFNEDLVLGKYFSFVFIQKKFRLLLELISPGGAGRNRVMSKTEFLKLTWTFPSIAEQTKIANFLLAIDKKIEGVDNQLEQTKQWKKGLLQQMFC